MLITRMLQASSSTAIPLIDLLRLLFSVDDTAPLDSPYTEGTGQVTLTDTGNKLSKATGKLVQATVTGAFSDPRAVGDLINRMAGRTLVVTGITGDSWRIGWASSGDTAVRGGVLAIAGAFYHYDNAVGVGQLVLKAGVSYDLLIILGNWGTMTAIRGGAWANWTMLGHTTIRTGAAGTTNSAATQKVYWDYNSANVSIDEIRVQDWGGIWSKSIFHAVAYELLPTSGDTYAGSSGDMFVQVGWVPASGTVLDILFRRTDDDNTWIVRCTQSANTIKLIEKTSGTETERQSTSFTWGTGTMVEIWIRAESSRIAYGVQGAQRNVYTSGSYNSGVTGVKLISTGSTDLARVMVFPLALPDVPTSAGRSPLNIFCLGDSKTGSSGDSGVPSGLTGGYPIYLMDGLEAARNAGAFETPGRYSLGGGTSVTIEAQMNAQLAARAHVADYVLVNIGANDATAGTSEANFKTAYGSILDKVHAKWSGAKVYCMLVWVRDYLSQCNSINTWIAAVIADGRSSWAFVGPDERVFLEGGDDGVTYTADGVHPNHAGYLLTAAEWQEAMGF